MRIEKSKLLLILLTVIFTIGLIFASIELPRILSELIKTPDYDQTASVINMGKSELFIKHYNLRLWGYVSLAIILILIGLSFFTKRDRLAVIGAFAMFLPVFGHFALAMFFLAGLGVLRFIWIPFTDLIPFAMQLGEIVYLPYNLIIKTGHLFNQNWHLIVSFLFITLGIILFILGVFAWFSTKFNKKNVVDIWIYKISRHPQYLGWILWSYGMFIFPIENQKRGWEYPDSLPWMLATIIIIAVSLFEEIKVQNQFGDDYKKFKEKTAFMFPMPKWLKNFLKHPLKMFFRKEQFTKKREVAVVSLYYLIFFMFVSYIYLAFNNPSVPFKLLNEKRKKEVSHYITQLQNGNTRRVKDLAALDLVKYKDIAVNPLISIMNDTSYYTRNYSIRALGEIGNKKAAEPILDILNDTCVDVGLEATKAFGKLNYTESSDVLLKLLQSEKINYKDEIVIVLAGFKEKNVVNYVLNEIEFASKYPRITYIEALSNFNDTEIIEVLIKQLNISDKLVKEAAIVALAEIKNTQAIESLNKLLHDKDWEVRIYAEEAIKEIKKRK